GSRGADRDVRIARGERILRERAERTGARRDSPPRTPSTPRTLLRPFIPPSEPRAAGPERASEASESKGQRAAYLLVPPTCQMLLSERISAGPFPIKGQIEIVIAVDIEFEEEDEDDHEYE
ncbi:MAG: hypothetical protein MUC63_06790, partial [Planctomycetes bacterium]|nr:hypothetical protein [Planctomycetota bacterium]